MDSKQKQPQEKQPQEKQLQFEQQADPGQPPQQPTQGPYLPQGPSTPWINKLCFKPYEDWDTCCLGLWLPCVLYGRTQTRLEKIYLGEDPLNESQLPKRNRYCCAWYSTFVFVKSSWFCTFTQHSRVRDTYNIKGSMTEDLAKSCCLELCTLMQADREVRSRAALDKKAATLEYDSSHQQMRYVPRDPFFGDSIDARKGPRNVPRITVIPPAVVSRQEMATVPQTDGAEPVIEMSQLQSMAVRGSVNSTYTGRKMAKGQHVPASNEKAKFMNECQQHGIVVKEPGKTANKKCCAGNHDQGKADSENTIIHKKEDSENQDRGPAGTNGCPDETVFVYYGSPTTPEPQKLRDCLKTRTSESMSVLNLNKRERSSEHNSSDSCATNEVLSFIEPSIRAMLRIENVAPTSSSNTEHIPVEHKQDSLTTESIPEESLESQSRLGGSSSSHSLMAVSERSDVSTHGSEETVKAKMFNLPTPPQSDGALHEHSHNQVHEVVPLHPKTRESIIAPSTPMELEEVLEEIDVDGEWKIPQDGKYGARTVGTKFGRKMRPSFFDGNSEP